MIRYNYTAAGYNAPGEDPYDEFLAWDKAQDEEERMIAREEARLEAWEASHEGRLD